MFEGFRPETADFLWGLRLNNQRDWFMAHKDAYLKELYEPMKALAAEISEPFVKKPGMICKTSRIYRDMRLAPPTPYKESLWTCIRYSSETWMDEPCLFFEITPDGCSFGFLYWKPTVLFMNELRKEMTEHSDTFLQLVKNAEKKSGIPLGGSAYVKPKNCANEELKPYYSLRNLTAIAKLPYGDAMFSKRLAARVKKVFLAYEPFLIYCQNINNRGKAQ